MSAREQAELLKLLHAWYQATQSKPDRAPQLVPNGGSAADAVADLIERTRLFIELRVPAPESHGQRRG